MATKIQLRRGPTSARETVVLSPGEPGWDTEQKKMYVGDGVTPGGVAIVTDASYMHTQGPSSASWVIVHNMNKYPSATVLDLSGDECEGAISYQSLNQMTIEFTAPFSGVAYLN